MKLIQALTLLLFATCTSLAQTSYLVSNINDSGAGSLRQAIIDANSLQDSSSITFDATVFASTQTIALTSSLPTIIRPLSITGPGSNLLTIRESGDAKAISLFSLSSGVTASFDGMTLGYASSGIINNGGNVTANNCTLLGNYRGSFNNGGTSSFSNCTFDGIYAYDFNNGSTAIFNPSGTTTATNCTLSKNEVGIYIQLGTVTLVNCTNSGNYIGYSNFSASLILRNSISAGNNVDYGGFTNGGNNIANTTAAAAGLDPAGLKSNGGRLQTIALATGSPAIDGGNNALITSGTSTDQRGSGYPRILGTRVDIGAYEAGTLQAGPNYIVNVDTDTNDGISDTINCSLREAIIAANSNGDSSTITFSPLFDTVQTINLGSSLPAITAPVTLVGPGAKLLTVREGDSNRSDTLFTVNSGVNATISSLTITNADNGILNNGNLTVDRCSFRDCWNGVFNFNTGTLNVTNSTFLRQLVGIYNRQILNTTNCTFVACDFGIGNFSFTTSNATVVNCTITGSLEEGVYNQNGTATLRNTICAGNNIDLAGAIINGGNNIFYTSAAGAGLDPAGLKDNGGPTLTIALVSGGAAVDAGSNALIPAGITTDQRGEARIFSGTVDIGAFELIAVETSYETWATTNGLPTDPAANNGENVALFAFAMSPTGPNGALNASELHAYVSGSGAALPTGTPIIDKENPSSSTHRFVFVRRKDYLSDGLTYTPKFSSDLTVWTDSLEVPTVIAEDSTHEIVSIPFPSSSTETNFAQIIVEISP